MRPSLRFLHLLGLALFLGSLPAHIVLGSLGPGGVIPPQGVLLARTMIKVITLTSTVPGLLLLLSTGLLRWRAARWEGAGGRWLTLHAVLGLIVAGLGLAVLTPMVLALAGEAQALVDGDAAEAAWRRLKAIEDAAGAFNLLAAVGAVALVCYRPALGRWLDRRASGL